VKFEGYQLARENDERYKYFIRDDFKGATVLDLGSADGMVTEKALKWGARSAVGLDLPEVDFNKNWNWEKTDIVLVLSLIRFINKKREFMKKVASIANRVIYFEGHQQEFTFDSFNLIKPNEFIWTKLGETPVARPFYRGVRKI